MNDLTIFVKDMKMKVFFFGYSVSLIFLVIGCATLPEPGTAHDTLVIGMIIHTGKDFHTYSHVSVNGVHRTGIEMKLKNITTNDEYSVKTEKNGLFYTVALPPGTYRIDQFYLKVSSGSAWADTYYSPGNLTFTIVKGKINNLGMINWDGRMGGDTNVQLSQLYNYVENEFRTQFSGSGWLKRDMTNQNITKK
ncbi:MAG: hypothetical protein LBK58_01470 [Prevotellaceae bacterium]|jgi:hypothetical protein|nr:hypothetical protein [Prevotellaceae bacterium]